MIQIKIGSAPGNTVVLNHPSVSPFHLEIVKDANGNFLLNDLNSMYGTTVNGYRIQGMVQLRPTDIVKAGELVLPWNTYFQYPPIPVTPVPNYYSPAAGQTGFTGPVSTPVVPEKPRNPKKVWMIVGGSVLGALLVLAGLIYLYTRPSYEHLKLIPSDAFIVTSINVKSIAGKIDLEKMQQLDFYKNIKREAQGENGALSKAMSDPMSSGIDIFSQPYAFMTMESTEYTRYTGGIVFAIKSESNFRVFAMRLADDESIKQSDEFSLIRLNDGSCLAWNDDAGLILFSDKSKTRTENYVRTLFEQSEKESMLSVETFTKFKEATYDIGFYLNYDALRVMPGVTIPSYMNGSASMATLTFNEGKLSYSSEYLQSSKDPDAAKSFLGKKGINDGLKATIPGKSYGIMSVSFDVNEIYKYMDRDQRMREVLDEIAGDLMLERKKLPGILTGEFYFSLADIKNMPVARMDYDYNYDLDTYIYTMEMDTVLRPAFIVGATAKDANMVEAILTRMEAHDTLNGIRYWSSYRQGNYYVAHNGANYFLTNDISLASTLKNGKAAVPVVDPMSSLISNDPVYSYFNLNLSKYPADLPVYLEDEMGRRDFADFETFMNMFDYAELVGDGTKQTLDVYFVDKKENCLNTFLQTANDLYLNHKR